MSQKNLLLYFTAFYLFLYTVQLWAQSPGIKYYYNPATELSWASCYIYQPGGSKQKIPFLSVGNFKFAPCGTKKYSRDIDVSGPIVFIGDGIVMDEERDCYGTTKVDGRIVMFCYDFPDSFYAKNEIAVPLEKRITEAVSRNVSAIILISYKQEYPGLYIKYENESDIPDIPIITISQNSARNIFESAGRDLEKIFRKWQKSEQPWTEKLITHLDLKIKGKFDKVETDNFIFRFRKELIPVEEMKQIAEVNERSVKFLTNFFKEEHLKWKKSFAVYFRSYDSKKFYTLHSGSGLSTEAGTFIVHGGGVPNYGLAAHENTHTIINSNWGESTSFMDEGIAKYAEAHATNKDMNHLQTKKFIKEGPFFALKDMVNFNIGRLGPETTVAYPASGSFVEFLVDSFGLKKLKELYKLEARSTDEKKQKSSWETALGKSISQLENEWLVWLSTQYKLDNKYIEPYINK